VPNDSTPWEWEIHPNVDVSGVPAV
jgi:hypothetical protein